MNVVDIHIGDYQKATLHLTAREDGMYLRMLFRYYSKEGPLPRDVAQVQRLMRCADDEDRQAVLIVLQEFFELREDGYHKDVCDERIALYQAGEPDRKLKKDNEDNRMKLHRLQRHRLFQVLVSAGIHLPWNVGMKDLREAAAAVEAGEAPPETQKAGRTATTATRSATPAATAPATPATAIHLPSSTLHTKEKNTSHLPVAPPRPDAEGQKAPACPHLAVLALWAEVLPSLPQHLPSQWRGARADHLRARWRETAADKGWVDEAQGLAYFRRLFAYVAQSQFLTGRTPQRDPAKRPFIIELEWLVSPQNWAKVIEGKYHQETA